MAVTLQKTRLEPLSVCGVGSLPAQLKGGGLYLHIFPLLFPIRHQVEFKWFLIIWGQDFIWGVFFFFCNI